MSEYDSMILLERVYVEGITKEGLSPETLEKIRVVLEEDKPNIDSVFGVAFGPDIWEKETMYIYVSDTVTWKKDGYCSDSYYDDSYDVLQRLGFGEEMDAVFAPGCDMVKNNEVPTKEEIIEKLISLGFKYDEDFENYMKDCFLE